MIFVPILICSSLTSSLLTPIFLSHCLNSSLFSHLPFWPPACVTKMRSGHLLSISSNSLLPAISVKADRPAILIISLSSVSLTASSALFSVANHSLTCLSASPLSLSPTNTICCAIITLVPSDCLARTVNSAVVISSLISSLLDTRDTFANVWSGSVAHSSGTIAITYLSLPPFISVIPSINSLLPSSLIISGAIHTFAVIFFISGSTTSILSSAFFSRTLSSTVSNTLLGLIKFVP